MQFISVVLIFLQLIFSSNSTIDNWYQLWKPTGKDSEPIGRAYFTINLLGDQLFMHGGMGEDGMIYNDTWIYDLKQLKWFGVTYVNQTEDIYVPRFTHNTITMLNTENEVILYTFGGLIGGITEDDKENRPYYGTNELWQHRISMKNSQYYAVATRILPNGTILPPVRGESVGINLKNEYMVIYGGISKVTGTEDEGTIYDDLWMYHIASNTWSSILPSATSNRPSGRFSHVGALYTNPEINVPYFVIGGGLKANEKDRHIETLYDLWMFDFYRFVWYNLDMKNGLNRQAMSVTSWGYYLIFSGGYAIPENGNAAVYVFDDVIMGKMNTNDFEEMNQTVSKPLVPYQQGGEQIEKGKKPTTPRVTWLQKMEAFSAPLPGVRHDHRSVVYKNNTMIIVGGRFRSALNDIWALRLNDDNLESIQPSLTYATAIGYLILFGSFLSFLSCFIGLIWFTRRFGRRGNDQGNQNSGAAHGLSKRTLKSIQVIHYSPEKTAELKSHREDELTIDINIPLSTTEHDGDTKKENITDLCAICLSEFTKGENVSLLDCTHMFHKTCIDEWFAGHTTCPMCKMDLEKSSEERLRRLNSRRRQELWKRFQSLWIHRTRE